MVRRCGHALLPNRGDYSARSCHSAHEPHRVCSVRQARTVHYGGAFFGRGEGERQQDVGKFCRVQQPVASVRCIKLHTIPCGQVSGALPCMSAPALPCLSIMTSSAAVTFANPSPQVLEGGLRSSTCSFSCSPRSRVLLLKLSCCLRPLVVTFAVAARSPRGHGGCSSRAPFLAGVLASTRPTAECAARDQTRSIADFGTIHALTRAFRPRGSALSAISFDPGERL